MCADPARPAFASEETWLARDRVVDAKNRCKRAGLVYRRAYFRVVFDCWSVNRYNEGSVVKNVSEIHLELVGSAAA